MTDVFGIVHVNPPSFAGVVVIPSPVITVDASKLTWTPVPPTRWERFKAWLWGSRTT